MTPRCLACNMKLDGTRAYALPKMDIVRLMLDNEVRTDIIVESDGSKWTDWYDLGNPEGPGIGE